MTTIYKYPLKELGTQHISVPKGYVPLHVGADPTGQLCLWCQVDPDELACTVTIDVVGTGGEVRSHDRHLGSAVVGSFVWHVFSR
jgi:hypothetical protein